ncbi:hypothetical protein CHLNCDRAFT_144499 [Chlorella variabilis]|uniref:Uncharacterized protein n=1 Tax=Chlorella variabilis TaxID=554065 RepID=E1ZBJ8_CHLVA|nr:hypothetical protein CHLNCDRAFT_144499 [Chlorella variabilis]EFN56869.1 hypothetical protein CHLNCDRAFT_144499 [Chlorella variabilis]|eukprot:XP_005848971.1 hypothetical protein CHLNCDRAFT_144499 [Chlorella variabilis]
MAAVRVGVVYYSQVLDGINSVEGCEGVMYQVAETLPPEVLERIKALPRSDDPVIRAEELPDFDGLIFGEPAAAHLLQH